MANIETWQQELESTGSVRIGTSMTGLIWRVGLAALLVMGFVYRQYQTDKIGMNMVYVALIGFALLIIACVMFVRLRYGGKHITIDQHGITNVDGNTYPWSDITSVGVYNDPRSADALQINLTADAWQNHIGKQNAAGSLMHKANKLVARNNAVTVPNYLDADLQQLSAWLNQYVRGTAEPGV